MGLKFDNVEPPASVDNIKKAIEQEEQKELERVSQEKAKKMRESVQKSTERIQENLKKELGEKDRGWIDKYLHSDLFKAKSENI